MLEELTYEDCLVQNFASVSVNMNKNIRENTYVSC